MTLLQVILSTNIAESSITVPDIKYGKSPLKDTCTEEFCAGHGHKHSLYL